MRDVRAHYIKSNDQARIPARYVILDAEALRERDERGEVQSWALAVVTFMEWTKQGQIITSTTRFETPAALWSEVSTFTRRGRRTVLYAHNLNYDLRISQALSCLPDIGWNLRDMRIDGRGSWSKWSRDKASLTLCDSASIFPVKLEQLATMFGMRKLPLPQSDEREKLFRRCERDVEILTAAITSYVQWLRSGQCGNWRMTGASQSWSHWRHSHYTHKILVHDNDQALAAERAAMHSGRCEAFRWGNQDKGPFWEYDWQNSYPRIAQDSLLPSRLCATITNPDPASIGSLLSRYAILAELEVSTKVPCVPTQYEGRTIWPVGTFCTTLWNPEIRLLQEYGATFRVRRAWLYQQAPVLKDWSEWILSSLHDPTGTVPEWQKLILKHWSRALIGRFGMRYRQWLSYATAEESRIYMGQYHDLDSGNSSELMQVGKDVFVAGEMKEIDDGCPQITSYIMSEARAKLWRAIATIGQSNVLYVDTDSLLVNATGHNTIQANYSDTLFAGLRSKGKFARAHIYGPRSLILAGKPVVSGMARSSTRKDNGQWESEVWRSGKESIRQGESDKVRIQVRLFTLRYNTNRRYFNGDGSTLPYELPGNAPFGQVLVRPRRKDWLDSIGYPPLLAHSQAKKHANGLGQDRTSDHDSVRSMSQEISDTNQGGIRVVPGVRQ